MKSLEYIAELELADEAAKARLSGVRLLFSGVYSSLDAGFRSLSNHWRKVGSDEALSLGHVPQVQAILASRVADDLRVLWLVAERGMVAQAFSISASVMEAAFTASLIGVDTKEAAQWWNWSKSHKAPYSAKRMREVAVATPGQPKDPGAVKGHELLYEIFSQGKHINPMLQRKIATAENPAAFVLRADVAINPATQSHVVSAVYWGCQTALEAFADLLPRATGVLPANSHLDQAARDVFVAWEELNTVLPPPGDTPSAP